MRKLAPGSSWALVSILGWIGIALAGCTDAGGPCTPLDPSEFSECDDPTQCISVTASWCTPGADGEVLCATNNVDLSLELPVFVDPNNPDELVTVGVGQRRNGCEHDGDEQAEPPLDRDGDGLPGPFDENITCSPYVHEMDPPDRIDPGFYAAKIVDNSSFFDTGDVEVSVYVNGQTSCQFVNVDNGTEATVWIAYPPGAP
jgi:hypothetical protein